MPPKLTPAQLELQAARRAAKAAAKERGEKPKLSPEEEERCRFLRREWIDVRPRNGFTRKSSGGAGTESSPTHQRHIRIVSWNILAQTLVRRDLFPTSDCLKETQRRPMLQAELQYYSSADVICLQECDRLKDYLRSLPDHQHITASGPGKKHGLVILYRRARFRVKQSKTVHLDEEQLSPAAEASSSFSSYGRAHELTGGHMKSQATLRRRRGGSRITKNVGLISALEEIEAEGKGVIIITTHLFWHPKYSYERLRQILCLFQAVQAFKAENKLSWPTILAGDLNTTPCEAVYQLLTNPTNTLPDLISAELQASRVIHQSLDNAFIERQNTEVEQEGNGSATQEGDDGEVEGDDDSESNDQALPRTRIPVESDGILEIPEIIRHLHQLLPSGLVSAYDSSVWTEDQSHSFGGRGGFERVFGRSAIPQGLGGANEPGYTCFTALFRLTLDYLLVDPSSGVVVTKLLRPAMMTELGDGLPKKGICASDHLAVGCELLLV